MGLSSNVKTQPLGLISKPSAYDNSSLLGKYLFIWVWRFFIKHGKSEIKPDDLHRCPSSCNSSKIGTRLEELWEEHVKKCQAKNKKPSLFWPVLRLYGPFYALVSLFCIIGYFFQVVQALCIGELLENVEKYKNESSTAEERADKYSKVLRFGAGILLSQLTYVAFINPFFFYAGKVGMNIRVACSSLVFRKSLKLSKTAFLKTSVGNIVNLLSNDTSRFDLCVMHTPFLIYGPISVFIALGLLWPYLSYTTVYGICLLLLYIPLQTVMGKQFSRLRAAAAQLTDERVRLMNEFIPAMRVIKMYAWEEPFAKMINSVRKMEVNKIKKSAFLRALNISLFYVSSKVIIFVIMSIWVIFYGNHLDPKTVFLTLSLMNHVRFTITLMFPNAISYGSEGMISFRRITTFLNLPERQESKNLIKSNFIVKGIGTELNIENLYASYGNSETKYLLKNGNLNGKSNGKSSSKLNGKSNGRKYEARRNSENEAIFDQDVLTKINLRCLPGELNVIVGPVGSGKSSILLAILGELFINKGRIDAKGRVSYASQEAWIYSGTVRDNILFNSVYDPEKYKEVVRVCALERDMTLFPQGDQTLIGDRGTSLSGGQRARINLARSLYLDADIYLLDDPLSAVDAHVAKHIFNEAITGYLSKKVVILVTHQLQFIKNADKILLLKNGQQIAYGDYNSLLNSLNTGSNQLEFSDFIGVNVDQNKQQQDNRTTSYRTVSISSESSLVNPTGSLLSLSSSVHLEDEVDNKKSNLDLNEKKDVEANKGERKVKVESENLAGSWRSYGVYIRLGSSWWVGPLLIITFFITQTLFTGSDWWLSLWTDSEQRKKIAFEKNILFVNQTFVDKFSEQENVAIYATQMFLLFIFSLLRGSVFFLLCMRASVRLHDRLFKKMVRAPMVFFETNPIGQILNRFSRDTGIIDDLLPITAFDAFGIIATDIGITILLLIVNIWTLVPVIVFLSLILIIRKVYIDLARRIKIIEGVTKSPVFTQLSTSLYGLTTIRAFNVQKRFETRFDTFQNDHSAAWFFYIASGRWLLFYMDLSSCVFVGGITFSMIFLIDQFNSATIGLMISCSIMFSGGFQWCMRQWTELEVQFTSVDRVDEYSRLIDEGDLESKPDKKPPENWPAKGTIEFRNVVMRYFKDENPVLNNLNFTITEGEKVGIVGRTGAGKSSIITALFRLTPFEGDIIIDGINTKDIGLHDLRKKLSIIPQDPVLFTGTVRYNLDPMDEHEDHTLWKVLEEIQLAKKIEEMNQGLYALITDSGSNFSVGQKQLICLARAILRNNKILILDEATANCDPKTDELIQKTIRTVFDCTILTIAHRLHTVMDASKILVMDAGEVKEFDKPLNLIEKKDSLLNKMIQSTGREVAKTLRKMAKEIHLLRSSNPLRLELGEKIAETITAIKEDKDSDLEDQLDEIDEDNLNRLIVEEEINKNESTHF